MYHGCVYHGRARGERCTFKVFAVVSSYLTNNCSIVGYYHRRMVPELGWRLVPAVAGGMTMTGILYPLASLSLSTPYIFWEPGMGTVGIVSYCHQSCCGRDAGKGCIELSSEATQVVCPTGKPCFLVFDNNIMTDLVVLCMTQQ